MLTFKAQITDVFERKLRKHMGGAGSDAVFSTYSDGWYIQLDGMISIYCGKERPKFTPGKSIRLSIQEES